MQRLIFHLTDHTGAIVGNYDLDIDDKTTVGVNYQVYDVKNPVKRLRKTSNNFTIPATAKNLYILGNPNSKEFKPFINNVAYNRIYCTYIIDNDIILNKQSVYLSEISDRISITITQGGDIIDILKSISWDTLVKNYCDYTLSALPFSLADATAMPIGQVSWGAFIGYIITIKGDLLKVGRSYSTAYKLEEGITIDDADNMYFFNTQNTEQTNKGYSSRFSISLEYLFNSISNLNTYDSDIPAMYINNAPTLKGNLLVDSTALTDGVTDFYPRTFIYCPDLIIRHNTDTPLTYPYGRWWMDFLSSFTANNGLDANNYGLAGLNGQEDKPDKTLYDLIIAVAQTFNCLVSFDQTSAGHQISLQRFDLINYYGDSNVVNWSKNIKGITKFICAPENIKQKNYVKIKSIPDNAVPTYGGMTITCKNKNIDYSGDLIMIDRYASYNASNTDGTYIQLLNDSAAFETFLFYISDPGEVDSATRNLRHDEDLGSYYATDDNHLEHFYRYGISYSFYETVMQYPQLYEIEKYLTVEEVKNLDFMNQYYIDQLGGSFFINKISGFNPLKSQDATKIELIKVSNKAAHNVPIDNTIWTDGIGDFWVDGVNDYWIY